VPEAAKAPTTAPRLPFITTHTFLDSQVQSTGKSYAPSIDTEHEMDRYLQAGAGHLNKVPLAVFDRSESNTVDQTSSVQPDMSAVNMVILESHGKAT
jgi:hypothetical protein